ncbi:MAG: hypothetical protein QOF78_1175 [Phycisphaerales bacterium]|jgi:septal ring factor EnvC (AmiA/AmiB activator)|nr:hypothetical protein [Phycisphaerales bacterium]
MMKPLSQSEEKDIASVVAAAVAEDREHIERKVDRLLSAKLRAYALAFGVGNVVTLAGLLVAVYATAKDRVQTAVDLQVQRADDKFKQATEAANQRVADLDKRSADMYVTVGGVTTRAKITGDDLDKVKGDIDTLRLSLEAAAKSDIGKLVPILAKLQEQGLPPGLLQSVLRLGPDLETLQQQAAVQGKQIAEAKAAADALAPQVASLKQGQAGAVKFGSRLILFNPATGRIVAIDNDSKVLGSTLRIVQETAGNDSRVWELRPAP